MLSSLSTLMWVLGLASLLVKAFAVIDCLTRRPDAFVAAGKRTKVFWGVILGVAALVNLLVADPIFIINLVGLIAALIYLLDVRPALKQVMGDQGFGFRRRRPPSDW